MMKEIYETDEIDEFGNKRRVKKARIKTEAFDRMKKEAKEIDNRLKEIKSKTMPKRQVVKEVEEIDEFGNKRMVKKLVTEEGPYKAPKTRDLKRQKITRKDSKGNIIEEDVWVDDEGNIIADQDISFTEEE